MEAGAQDDETKAAEAGTATPDGGPAGPVASRSAYTPLFLAQHEDRYLRRDLIKDYQQRHGCNLVVLIDQITQDSITLFAELLYGLDRSQDLHLLLASPGGDGGAAVRLARVAPAACRELVVIVPEMAKSAATILALGAHSIVMGPTSDLGPAERMRWATPTGTSHAHASPPGHRPRGLAHVVVAARQGFIASRCLRSRPEQSDRTSLHRRTRTSGPVA